MIIRILLQGD